MRRFLIYGLPIASEYELLLQKGSDASAPVVTIKAASSDFFAAFRCNEEATTPPKMCRYEPLPDGSSYVSWYALCDFFISSDGGTIICGPRSDAFSDAHINFLLSFVLSFALLRIGDEPLHATAVEYEGQAIGFLGNSGAGKSTLASYFLRRGARLLTDDMLRITFHDQSLTAHPGPQRIKLLPESAALFLQGASCSTLVSPFSQKQLIIPSTAQTGDRGVPLRALYLLDCQEKFEDTDTVSLQRLKSAQAALSIIGSTFNGAVRTAERLERQLRFTGKVLSSIPVFRLSYPRRFDVLSLVYERVVLGGTH